MGEAQEVPLSLDSGTIFIDVVEYQYSWAKIKNVIL